MAAATKAMMGRKLKIPIRFSAPPIPIRKATPRMISHSGLVCLPAATNAFDGRRSASTKPQTSQTKAAIASISRNQ